MIAENFWEEIELEMKSLSWDWHMSDPSVGCSDLQYYLRHCTKTDPRIEFMINCPKGQAYALSTHMTQLGTYKTLCEAEKRAMDFLWDLHTQIIENEIPNKLFEV